MGLSVYAGFLKWEIALLEALLAAVAERAEPDVRINDAAIVKMIFLLKDKEGIFTPPVEMIVDDQEIHKRELVLHAVCN